MTNYLALPPGDESPYQLNAVIEIPKGSNHKYEYDKNLNVFRLDRILFSPVHYPGAYGFVPQTLAEDGDPLDVVVIIDGETFTGCVIEVRPLGVLVMRDDMGLDHKILAVPACDPRMQEVHGLQHLPSHYLKEIDYFFQIYKELEGKQSDTYGWEDRLAAFRIIEESLEAYRDYQTGIIDRWRVPTEKGRRLMARRKAHAAAADHAPDASALAVEHPDDQDAPEATDLVDDQHAKDPDQA